MHVRAFPGFNFPAALKEARESSRPSPCRLKKAQANPKTKTRPVFVFS
jgi:hypothetical protein